MSTNRFKNRNKNNFVIEYDGIKIKCKRLGAELFMQVFDTLSRIQYLEDSLTGEPEEVEKKIAKIKECTQLLLEVILNHSDINESEIKELDMVEVVAIANLIARNTRLDPKGTRAKMKSAKK